jgi:hypothetical protein
MCLVTLCQRIYKLTNIKTGTDVGLFGKRMSRYVIKLKKHLREVLLNTKEIVVSVDGKFRMSSSRSVVNIVYNTR